jgi:hypothetical protein
VGFESVLLGVAAFGVAGVSYPWSRHAPEALLDRRIPSNPPQRNQALSG